jgi:Protein of unknown function (DUF664)
VLERPGHRPAAGSAQLLLVRVKVDGPATLGGGAAPLLVDAFGKIREVVHRVVDGLTSEQLALCLDLEANSIAWLVWHLTRIQDDHLADAAGAEQVWTS